MELARRWSGKSGRKLKLEERVLHEKFVRYGTNAKEWMRKCVLLLPEIERGRIWDKKGFGSIYEYAAKLAGMSRETVNEGLRILRKIEDKPELKKVVEVRGINAVRPVVKIATVETSEFWAEKASTMAKNTLEMYVREFRTRTADLPENPHQEAIGIGDDVSLRATAGNEAISCKWKTFESKASKVTIGMQLSPEIFDQLQKLKGNRDWNELMKELLDLRKEKSESEKPESAEAKSRHIPAKIRQQVLKRTNGTCSFPRCINPSKIFHHTQRFFLESIHDPDRIEPLCEAHERIAHHGLVEYEEKPPEYWCVREQQDETDPKHRIDQLVGKYRKPG